jgi:DamX protein
MDTTELQARIPQLTHLLPSQREWLERLLFQLAFSDCQQVYIVGAVGTGKSTLALALAELLSEHYNIALLTVGIDESQVNTQLMQQWFSTSAEASLSLAEQVEQASSALPLAVIVDDSARYSKQLMQQLKALNCSQFYFSEVSPDDTGLVLTINRITAADAEQLLQPLALNNIELSQRLAQANGNMHLILQPHAQISAMNQGGVTPIKLPVNPLLYGIAAVIFAVLAYVFWPSLDEEKPDQPQLTSQLAQPIVTSPIAEPAEISSSATESKMPELEVTPETTAEDAEALALPGVGSALPEEQTIVEQQSNVEQQTQLADASELEPATAEQAEVELKEESRVTSDSADIATLFRHDELKLLALQKQQVAIQLAVLSSEAALLRFKRAYPQLDTLSYQRNWQGKMQLVLLLAPFDDAAAAKSEIRQLPQALRETGLFVKALQAAQAEIRARQNSQQSANAEQ